MNANLWIGPLLAIAGSSAIAFARAVSVLTSAPFGWSRDRAKMPR